MRTSLLIVLSAFALSGCASLKSHFENDPVKREPSGDKVHIEVVGQDGKNIDGTIFGKVVHDEAAKWLTARGYRIVKEQKQAHSGVVFVAAQETKQVQVPGQTYGHVSSIVENEG